MTWALTATPLLDQICCCHCCHQGWIAGHQKSRKDQRFNRRGDQWGSCVGSDDFPSLYNHYNQHLITESMLDLIRDPDHLSMTRWCKNSPIRWRSGVQHTIDVIRFVGRCTIDNTLILPARKITLAWRRAILWNTKKTDCVYGIRRKPAAFIRRKPAAFIRRKPAAFMEYEESQLRSWPSCQGWCFDDKTTVIWVLISEDN